MDPHYTTIQDRHTEEVEKRRKRLVFALIIALVASLSFGLGYLANREFNHAPIIIQKAGEQSLTQ